MAEAEDWRPGSFTKNFSWGNSKEGLRQLYEIIRIGFADKMQDVSRPLFRERVAHTNRPDYIAINFFLFNKVIGGEDYIIADELVFQALNFAHSAEFDKLGLFAFNFSLVGKWKGAASFQARPALWAQHYITDRVAGEFNWDTRRVSADDIQAFVRFTVSRVGSINRRSFVAARRCFGQSILKHAGSFSLPLYKRASQRRKGSRNEAFASLV